MSSLRFLPRLHCGQRVHGKPEGTTLLPSPPAGSHFLPPYRRQHQEEPTSWRGPLRTPSELAWWSRWRMSPLSGLHVPTARGTQGQLGRLLVSFHPLPQAPPHWRERCGGQPPSSPSNTHVRLGGPLSAPCSSLQVGGADGPPPQPLTSL